MKESVIQAVNSFFVIQEVGGVQKCLIIPKGLLLWSSFLFGCHEDKCVIAIYHYAKVNTLRTLKIAIIEEKNECGHEESKYRELISI